MTECCESGLYDYLAGKDIPGFTRTVKKMDLRKGEELYNTSQPYTDIYEIIHGAVKLGSVSVKNEEFIYELATGGEVFGNIDFLEGTFSKFCKAIVPTSIYVYPIAFFKEQVFNDPTASQWFIKKIVTRWNKTETLLSAIRTFEPRDRITQLYYSLNRPVTTAVGRDVLLSSQLTRKDIADLTATTRQLVADTLG